MAQKQPPIPKHVLCNMIMNSYDTIERELPSDSELGEFFRTYMTGTIHDTSWEGYDRNDLVTIDRLFGDMVLFLAHRN